MKKVMALVIAVLIISVFSSSAICADYDFGGRTVTFAMPHQYYSFDEGEDLAHKQWVEEMFNVKIELKLIPAGEIVNSMVAGVMAGDPPADAFWIPAAWVWGALQNGAAACLDGVADGDYFDRLPPLRRATAKAITNYCGHTFALMGDRLNGDPNFIVWNKTYIEELGFPSLYELYENGEWTWEKFREIAIAATQDTDGDGKIDKWGLGWQGGNDDLNVFHAMNFVFSNGGQVADFVDGRYVFMSDQPAMLETLELMRDLVERKVFHPQHYPWQDFAAGNIAMGIDLWYDPNWDVDYGLMFPPKGPNGEEYFIVDTVDNHVWIFPRTIDDVAAMVELTSALFRLAEPYLDIETFEEQYWEDFAMLIKDYESLEIWQEMMATKRVNTYMFTPAMQWDAYRSVLYEGKSAAAAMKEVAPQAQAEMDDFFGKILVNYGFDQ